MNLKKTMALLLMGILGLSALAACGELDADGLAQAAASTQTVLGVAKEDVNRSVYYYKEYFYPEYDAKGNEVVIPSRLNEVNLYAERDSDGKIVLLESGTPKDYKIKIYNKYNDVSDDQYISGVSSHKIDPDGGDKDSNFVRTETTFYWNWERDENNKETTERRRYDLSREDFLKSKLFAPYSIASKLDFLTKLTADDLDFTGKSIGVTEKKGDITVSFRIKQSFFDREGNGFIRWVKKAGDTEYTDLLNTTNRVEVEVDDGQLVRVTLYKPVGGWMIEEEIYALTFSKESDGFDVDDFQSDDWKDVELAQ
jgi:hypothetical protein